MGEKQLLRRIILILTGLALMGMTNFEEEALKMGEDLEKRSRAFDPYIQEMINGVSKQNFDKLLDNEPKEELSDKNDELIDNTLQNNTNFTPIPTSKYQEGERYLLISWSLSDKSIENYMEQAIRHKVSLVMRGLKDNSIDITEKKWSEFPVDKREGITIYPQIFKDFNVTQVPAFIQIGKDGKYDIVYGEVGIAYFLELIEKEGESNV